MEMRFFLRQFNLTRGISSTEPYDTIMVMWVGFSLTNLDLIPDFVAFQHGTMSKYLRMLKSQVSLKSSCED